MVIASKQIRFFIEKEIIMSSKFRKHLKFVPQFFTILGALSMAFAMLLSIVNLPVLANGGVVDWEGNGSDNLPCNGVAQWNFTGGKDVTSAVLTVNGQNYGMNQTGGVWKANVSGLGTEVDAYVTYTGELGNGNAVLTISHCTEDETPDPTNTPVSPTFTPSNTPTNTQVPPTLTPSNTPTNTQVPPTLTPSNTPTNTAVPDEPTQTPEDPTQTPEEPTQTPEEPTQTPEVPTETPVETETPPTEVPSDPDPTVTPEFDETPDPTDPPEFDETPDPTDPPEVDETPVPTDPPVVPDEPEPTLPPPVVNNPPAVLIPVTGIEFGGNSPLSNVQNSMFNLGLSFLGFGLVLQSLRKRLNF